MQLAGLASIGAGIIHAGAVGVHADDVTLARLFVACAVAQVAVGLLALVRGGRLAAALTRSSSTASPSVRGRRPGCSTSRWIGGLEHSRAAGVHRHRLRRARRDRRRRRARRDDPPAHGGDRRPPRRAGVGDRIVRRRGDAARCHPRPRCTARPPGTPTTTPRRWRPTPPMGTATPRPTTPRPPTRPGSPPV